MIDDLLLYTTPEGVLMAARFDVDGKKLKSNPTPVLTDIDINQTSGDAKISLSHDGTLVYASGLSPVQVVLADSHGNTERLVSGMLPFRIRVFPPMDKRSRSPLHRPVNAMFGFTICARKLRFPLTPQGTGIVNERAEWSPMDDACFIAARAETEPDYGGERLI